MLNRNAFELKTFDEVMEAKLGCRQQKILDEYATRPLERSIRVVEVERRLGLTGMQSGRALESLVEGVGGSGQVLTKYKTQHLIEYQKLVESNNVESKGWVYSEVRGLTEAIDDLGFMYDRMVARFSRYPWNYVLLTKLNNKPIYQRMQFEILRNELNVWK
jgi:hypothetical protein